MLLILAEQGAWHGVSCTLGIRRQRKESTRATSDADPTAKKFIGDMIPTPRGGGDA